MRRLTGTHLQGVTQRAGSAQVDGEMAAAAAVIRP